MILSYTDEESGEEITEKTKSNRIVGLSEEDHEAVIEAIAKSIQYIIKLDAVNGTINLNGAAYDDEYGISVLLSIKYGMNLRIQNNKTGNFRKA